MWSMWSAPSDLEYYDSLGGDRDEDQPEICEDCDARWDLGEACEEWCATNRGVPELVPVPERREEDDHLFLANSLFED